MEIYSSDEDDHKTCNTCLKKFKSEKSLIIHNLKNPASCKPKRRHSTESSNVSIIFANETTHSLPSSQDEVQIIEKPPAFSTRSRSGSTPPNQKIGLDLLSGADAPHSKKKAQSATLPCSKDVVTSPPSPPLPSFYNNSISVNPLIGLSKSYKEALPSAKTRANQKQAQEKEKKKSKEQRNSPSDHQTFNDFLQAGWFTLSNDVYSTPSNSSRPNKISPLKSRSPNAHRRTPCYSSPSPSPPSSPRACASIESLFENSFDPPSHITSSNSLSLSSSSSSLKNHITHRKGSSSIKNHTHSKSSTNSRSANHNSSSSANTHNSNSHNTKYHTHSHSHTNSSNNVKHNTSTSITSTDNINTNKDSAGPAHKEELGLWESYNLEDLVDVPVSITLTREFVVATVDTKSIGGECPICFDEFEANDQIARLQCLCIYHPACIRAWYEKSDSALCPVHRDLSVHSLSF